MTVDVKNLVAVARQRLRAASNAKAAPAMAAYMKTTDPFFGVKRPDRAVIEKELTKHFHATTRADFERAANALWKGGKEREWRYVALAYARKHPEHLVLASLPLFERWIREGQWWDTVDEIAANLVGAVYARDAAHVEPILKKWIDDPNMWIRRTAILSQLRRKKDTNEKLLFAWCLRRSHEKEFFVRKAIGWALRQYSYTAPKAVERFIAAHETELAPLSVREGRKALLRSAAKAQSRRSPPVRRIIR